MLISRNNDWLLHQFAIFITFVGLFRPTSYHSALVLLVRCHTSQNIDEIVMYTTQLCILKHSGYWNISNYARWNPLQETTLFSENVLKLTYGNVELKKFSVGVTPGPPLPDGRGREWWAQAPPPSHKFLATSLCTAVRSVLGRICLNITLLHWSCRKNWAL